MPNTRRMRTALMATFAAVVAALAVVGVTLGISVQSPLRTLRTISDAHARAVRLTATIRSSMSQARREVLAEVLAPRSDPAHFDASRVYAGLHAPVTELSRVCDTPFELERLAALRAALSRSAEQTAAVEELIARGDRERALDSVGAFLAVTSEANDAADAIIAFNAEQVEEASGRVQRSITALVAGMLALTLAGAAGAYLVLRLALLRLESHQALWRTRFTDVDAFAARVAHELRTPLQTLKLALASRSPGALDRAHRGVERVTRTIDALLEFCRAGAVPSAEASANVRSAIDEVRDELAPVIEQQRATLDVDADPEARVAMSIEHLRTVIRNVVGNALRYGAGPSGGRVTVRSSATDGWVHVEVGDEGPGIPASALEHVFEPFVRATGEPGGYGIGLATVRRIVEGHGGTIAIDSTPGRGTRVRITLPRRSAGARDPGRVAR
jgi:signal transduction histidine kinase